MSLDFLLRGGFIIDGTSDDVEPRPGDIGIEGDRIKTVGNLSKIKAENIIDISGLYVCPGFIDSHAHSEFTLLADGRAEGKICQGITTEVNGNCGLSAAPLYGPAFEQRTAELKELGIKERWNSLSEYFELLDKKRFATNFLTLVGHGNLRASVSGYENRQLAASDKNRIFSLLKDSLGSGATGLSTGLIYPPGVYSDTSEIIELARATKMQGGNIYTTHMRNEEGKLLEAVTEAIRISFESGLHLHISHLKTHGEKNWEKIKEVFRLIDNAHKKGVRLTCDRYPYVASCTDLDVILPFWAYEGGHSEELRKIKNEQKRLADEILKAHPEESYWERVKISRVNLNKNKWMEGKSLAEISKSLHKPPVKCLFEILIEEDLRAEAIFFLMSEDNLKSILKRPYTMIGSDSSARSFDGITAKGKPHPRGFGSFPRVLSRYVREQEVIPLEKAVYKMTGLPAKTFGIKNRGIINKGFFADITVFDAGKIKDRATFDKPFVKPGGVYYVFINGKPVIREGVLTGELPGRILKK